MRASSIMLALLLLAMPAAAFEQRHVYAQLANPPAEVLTPEERHADLSRFFSMIIDRRVKKEWTPQLYAAPATAAALGTIAGIVVMPDPAMKQRWVQMRNAEPFPDTHQFTRQPIVVPAGSVMAEQTW